jgi:hypothetical protein
MHLLMLLVLLIRIVRKRRTKLKIEIDLRFDRWGLAVRPAGLHSISYITNSAGYQSISSPPSSGSDRIWSLVRSNRTG